MAWNEHTQQQEAEEGRQPTEATPIELLWQFLAQRCGQDLADEAHLYFNEQKRLYEKRRRDAIFAGREQGRGITFPPQRGYPHKAKGRHDGSHEGD